MLYNIVFKHKKSRSKNEIRKYFYSLTKFTFTMQYISLNNSSLTYFTSKGKVSDFGGSSKYHVWNGEICLKEKKASQKIENRTGTLDYLNFLKNSGNENEVIERLLKNYDLLKKIAKSHKFTSENELNRLEILENLIQKNNIGGPEFCVSEQIVKQQKAENESRYKTKIYLKKDERQINKTKVKNKMYSLFNLKNSQKFIAFYSVSFPLGTSDDSAFICWNYFLTYLRKHFGMENYIWVTERQKNETIHFHMLTNQYMPILQVNRAMAIIINNQVKENNMSWKNSSLEKYNGVDVDSVFNSKRHKKTGKAFNPAELRNWLTKYITKYVTKNSAKFSHLCWHCSRSVSVLFSTTVLQVKESHYITDFLPHLRHLYINYKGEFNDTWVFKFVPPENIFKRIKWYNDMLSVEFEPINNKNKSVLNYKSVTL